VPDPDRQGRLAVAWIVGIFGVLAMAAIVIGGFAILFATGQRQSATVTGAPFPTTAPAPILPASPSGQDPASPTTGAGSEPPESGNGAPSRSTNEFYSIRIPEGFADVTDSYHSEHPTERDTVQALAAPPGSLSPSESSIVISRL